jgi:hypothetical protein
LEVIQPQVLLRLPCYDFFPVAILMLDVPLRTCVVQGRGRVLLGRKLA